MANTVKDETISMISNEIAKRLQELIKQEEAKATQSPKIYEQSDLSNYINNMQIETPQPQEPLGNQINLAEYLKHVQKRAQYDAYGKANKAFAVASALAPVLTSALGAYLSGKSGLGAGLGAEMGARAGAVVPTTYQSVVQQQMQPYLSELQMQMQQKALESQRKWEEYKINLQSQLQFQAQKALKEIDKEIKNAELALTEKLETEKLESLDKYRKILGEYYLGLLKLRRYATDLNYQMGSDRIRFDSISQISNSIDNIRQAVKIAELQKKGIQDREGREKFQRYIEQGNKLANTLESYLNGIISYVAQKYGFNLLNNPSLSTSEQGRWGQGQLGSNPNPYNQLPYVPQTPQQPTGGSLNLNTSVSGYGIDEEEQGLDTEELLKLLSLFAQPDSLK